MRLSDSSSHLQRQSGSMSAKHQVLDAGTGEGHSCVQRRWGWRRPLYLQTTRCGSLARAPASLWAMSWERYLTPAPNATSTKPWPAVSFTQASNSCGSNGRERWLKKNNLYVTLGFLFWAKIKLHNDIAWLFIPVLTNTHSLKVFECI